MAKTPKEAALAIVKRQKAYFRRNTSNRAGLSAANIGASSMVAILESGPCSNCVKLCASVSGRENIGCQGIFTKPGDLARQLVTEMVSDVKCEEFQPIGSEQVINTNGV